MRLLYILIALSIVACNSNNDDFVIKKELEFIDSLEQRMAILNKKLDIDYPEIQERIEEMHIDIMKMRMTDKVFPKGMGVKMDRYVNIKKSYEKFYTPFKSASTEAAEINNQILTLKESVLKQEFGKEKFKEYYQQELKSINDLAQYMMTHIQPILDMEMEYRRIQKSIDQFLYKEEIEELNNQ
jgi:hypothetical protein